MSIRTPFNPLGTLGAASGYVQDGLLFCFDASKEPDSNPCRSIHDQVSGASLSLNNKFDEVRMSGGGLFLLGDYALSQFFNETIFTLPASVISRLTPQAHLEICARFLGATREANGLGIGCFGSSGKKFGYVSITDSSSTLSIRASHSADAAQNDASVPIDGTVSFAYSAGNAWLNAVSVEMSHSSWQWTYFPANGVCKTMYNINAILYSIRIYSAPLNAAQVRSNYYCDKRKFGL